MAKVLALKSLKYKNLVSAAGAVGMWWATRSIVQAGAGLVGNPASGGYLQIHACGISTATLLSNLFLLPVRMSIVDLIRFLFIKRLMPPFRIVVADKGINSLA